MQAGPILSPSQNKCSFRSWARKIKRGKKVESTHETRRGRGGERDKNRVVLQNENNTFCETNFKTQNHSLYGTEIILSILKNFIYLTIRQTSFV